MNVHIHHLEGLLKYRCLGTTYRFDSVLCMWDQPSVCLTDSKMQLMLHVKSNYSTIIVSSLAIHSVSIFVYHKMLSCASQSYFGKQRAGHTSVDLKITTELRTFCCCERYSCGNSLWQYTTQAFVVLILKNISIALS